MTQQKQPKPYPLRMAENLKNWIQERAKRNDRKYRNRKRQCNDGLFVSPG